MINFFKKKKTFFLKDSLKEEIKKNFMPLQKEVETLNKNIPNSDLKIIKGCSHNVHLEKPDEFNVMVGEFLKKN